MSEIELFRFPETDQPMRAGTLPDSDEAWFVAPDVCAILKHSNVTMAVAGLDDDEKKTIYRGSSEALRFPETFADLRIQSIVLVSEPGLYSLVMRSKVEGAKRFRRWVTHEVLPAIRKTGRYAVEVAQPALPDSLPTALRALADEIEAHNETKGQLAEQRPKAAAFDHLMEADGTFEWAATAQIFSRLTGGLGRNNFLELLRELKVLKADNTPYQHNYEPYFRVRANAGGNKTTYVTPRGLEWLRRRLVKHFNPQDALFAIGDIA